MRHVGGKDGIYIYVCLVGVCSLFIVCLMEMLSLCGLCLPIGSYLGKFVCKASAMKCVESVLKMCQNENTV